MYTIFLVFRLLKEDLSLFLDKYIYIFIYKCPPPPPLEIKTTQK